MCGIIGIWAKNNQGKEQIAQLPLALSSLKHRGPNNLAYKLYSKCGLGHARLSIIDTDERSNQPFLSEGGRYALVFNGEIYNYLELKKDLEKDGVVFKTTSDTEVLLQLLIKKGKAALQELNGFFAFAFYDTHEEVLLIARDQMGIKPLYIYEDDMVLVLSSEVSAFQQLDLNLKVDKEALNHYFGLTYFTEKRTVYNGMSKLFPGQYLILKGNERETGDYTEKNNQKTDLDYGAATLELRKLLSKSVSDRMVSDVPLGSFLSGGLDSSIIAALAAQINPKLKTFSIGFDHVYFDESNYASEVAEHIGSDHISVVLTQADFKSNFNSFLNTIDEPFADSSAFAVYLLSKRVKEDVTVALSGDGADELFGGYRKHFADYKIRKMSGSKKGAVKLAAASLKPFRASRSDRFGELNRKVQKLKSGLTMDHKSRYFKWCQFIDPEERQQLLIADYHKIENPYNEFDWEDLNAVLLADQKLVLPNDMLKKVDLMSMANSLEVRTPFLDVNVVDFSNSLPAHYKINAKGGKQILKAAFEDLLPASVLNRSKKGFEIPIKEWLNDEIQTILNGPLFTGEFIKNQGLFKHAYILKLQAEWSQPNFGDKIYMVWALIVFQHWWARNTANAIKNC
ncbi:MAG: asparagine synthase (glutamine-hydrolyzing) [Crocinitomix sp.]|nr:asparagine synthase (glutamine-hydrolyzing) [Crocinitomix sp.]